jgi:sortase A
MPSLSRFSRRRRFRRRNTGLLALVPLALLLLGGALYLGIGSLSGTGGEPVERAEIPATAEAPEAAEDREAKKDVEKKDAEKKAAEERAAAEVEPPVPSDPTLYMTVPKLGLYNNTVRNDDSGWAVEIGAVKLPSTAFPWQDGGNTYIAAHRVGWPGTESDHQFYNLPSMVAGDEIILTDANGTTYTYEVSEVFAVTPYDVWVTAPVPGRDVITLQTCTESLDDWWTIGPRLMSSGPDSGRLIVRADRVDIEVAA